MTPICGSGTVELSLALTFHREMKDTAPNGRPADWALRKACFCFGLLLSPSHGVLRGFSVDFSLVLVGSGGCRSRLVFPCSRVPLFSFFFFFSSSFLFFSFVCFLFWQLCKFARGILCGMEYKLELSHSSLHNLQPRFR